MSKKVDNPMLDIPIEFDKGEMPDETDQETDEPSLEELAAEIESRNTKKPKVEAESTEKVETKTEEVNEVVDEVDPRFAGKSAKEMIEIYKNVEKLAKAHDTELGELRKKNKEYKDKVSEVENTNLTEIENQIIPEIEKWTPEAREEWFKLFNTEPEKALKQATDKLLKPYRSREARNTNIEEVKRLKKIHKDHVVPYIEKDINSLIAVNEDWWKEHKGNIFEHAYNVIRNRDFDKYSAIREQEIKEKAKEQTEKEEQENSRAFVEDGAPARIVKEKGVTLEQLRHAKPETAMSAIEKILEARGVKVSV